MKNISKSPERMTFQKEGYVDRCQKKGEDISQAYLDMFDQMLEKYNTRFEDPESHKNNLEYDLLTTDWILEKVRDSKSYAQNLYAAMCNNQFQRNDVLPILKDQYWSCSWRYAGGIIADMRQEGDYINWYCSGIGGPVADYTSEETDEEWQKRTGYVPEGVITDVIREDLFKLGWLCFDEDSE